MNPIFNEYITFLRDTSGESLPDLKEGYFWLDRQIIKGFDKQGNIHKFYRINISDSLKLSIDYPKSGYDKVEDVDLASWNDLVKMHERHLYQIEKKSKNIIKKKMRKFNGYIPLVPVSMGKDSMVTCHLVRECYPDTKAIFNNTTLDCADTYRMAKTFPNCEMMTPKQGFYSWIKEVNWIPSRIRRGCCSIFKVGEMINRLDKDTNYLLFMGMRNEESNTRSGYGDEIVNPEWGDVAWKGILPIRKWSELDIWLYTLWKKIETNPKYNKGYSRVGCAIACPYYTKSTWILDKYWYPTMRKRWEDILREYFIKNKMWITFNCTIDEYINQAWNGGTFREEPTEEVIKEYAEYSGIDESLAEQYFNKYCANGCKTQSGKQRKIKDKEILAMNMKLHGRNISKFMCKKCLMNMHNMTKDDWDMQVAEFKKQGCDLF